MVDVMLLEKYTLASNIRRERYRLISGITALNLIQEGKFEDAEGYRQVFIEYKNIPIEELVQNLSFGFLPNSVNFRQLTEVASKLHEIADFLSEDLILIKSSDNIEKYPKVLVGLLNDLSPASR